MSDPIARILTVPVAVVAACWLCGMPAPAEVIRVEGLCQLDDAIDAANSNMPAGDCDAGSGADLIVLTDTVTLGKTNNEKDGWNGLPRVTSEITIDGGGHQLLRADNAAPPYRFFYVETSGDLTIRNLSLGRGRAPTYGGGAVLNRGTLEIYDSELGLNEGLDGGAIRNDAVLRIEDSLLWDNTSSGSGGGGAVFAGWNCAVGICSTSIERSRFSENTAGTNRGGAVSNEFESFLFVFDSEFDLNEAGNGGGISNAGSLFVTRSLFRENMAIGGGSGGGVSNGATTGATATITNSTFSENEAWNGGGLFNARTCTVRQSTFYGNVATNNVTTHAAAIHGATGWTTQVEGTIVDASVYNAGGSACSASVIDLEHNFGCTTGDPAVTNLHPPLIWNGGPTKVHALLAGSNAIDNGGGCEHVDVDQRGVTRMDPCDAGAHDYGECEDHHYRPGNDVDHATIDSTVVTEACEYLWASYFRVVGPGGDVTLRAGKLVTLFDLSVEGGTLTIEHDPSLLP